MFKHSKKSKISNLVLKRYKVFKYRVKNHIDTYDEAHYSLMDSIDEIYSNNKFTYEDYLLRKEKLTTYSVKMEYIYFSIILAIILDFILNGFNEVTQIVDSNIWNVPEIWVKIAFIVAFIIFYIVWISGTVFLIIVSKRLLEILNDDYFNTKDYELSIIENKLNELDEKHRQDKGKKQGVKNDTNCTAI